MSETKSIVDRFTGGLGPSTDVVELPLPSGEIMLVRVPLSLRDIRQAEHRQAEFVEQRKGDDAPIHPRLKSIMPKDEESLQAMFFLTKMVVGVKSSDPEDEITGGLSEEDAIRLVTEAGWLVTYILSAYEQLKLFGKDTKLIRAIEDAKKGLEETELASPVSEQASDTSESTLTI